MIAYSPYKPITRSSFAKARPSFANKSEKHHHCPEKASKCNDSHCTIDHTKASPPKVTPKPPPEPQGDIITRTLQKFWTWLKALILGPFQDLKWLFEGGASQEGHVH